MFDAIGYNFGGQSEVTTGFFRLPDMRGRMPMGKDNMGGTSADVVTADSADNLGSAAGSEEQTLIVQNLPEHKHNLRGDSLDQFYAIRDVSGTPSDADAVNYDAPTGTGAGQALPNSGGILTDSDVGQAFSIMNPHLVLNYIIYTGRSS